MLVRDKVNQRCSDTLLEDSSSKHEMVGLWQVEFWVNAGTKIENGCWLCAFACTLLRQSFCSPQSGSVAILSTLPLQKIPPSDNIIFFAEMDGGFDLGGAMFGFFRSFDLRLQSGL